MLILSKIYAVKTKRPHAKFRLQKYANQMIVDS
jgi:hypothetical protein